MTRLVQCGWETGDAQQPGAATFNGTNVLAPVAVATSPTPRSGGYCLKCAHNAPAGNPTNIGTSCSKVTIPLGGALEYWYAFGFYWTHTYEPGGTSYVFFHTLDNAGNVNALLVCDAGIVRAYAATAGGSLPASTALVFIGAATVPISGGAWHLVEVRIASALGATGSLELYLDGELALNATGVRTANLNNQQGAVVLGVSLLANPQTGASVHAFDDLRVNRLAGTINNGRPGDETIRLLVPAGPGDLTQLARGGTDSGANWNQVEEVPASAAEYVQSATSGETDLYDLGTATVGAVSAVTVMAYAAGVDTGSGQILLPTRTPAGQVDGTAITLPPTWTWRQRLLETDPADGAPWDQAKINGLQLGAKMV